MDYITQEHAMGCGVACVAYLMNQSYEDTLKLFKTSTNAWNKGFFCQELINVLRNKFVNYRFTSIISDKLLQQNNIIVFIAANEVYQAGHYLAKKEDDRWMNPWINYPLITPASGGFTQTLPGQVSHIIYQKHINIS